MALWIWPALFVWLVLAAVLPSALGRLFAVWFGALLVVVTVGIHLVRRSIAATTSVPARLVHGEHTDLVVTIRNRGWLPAPRVRVRAVLPSGGFSPAESVIEVALPRRTTREIRIPVTAHSRGRWRPEPAEVVVSDPWGIHELRTAGARPSESVVLPALVPVRRVQLPAVSPLAEVPDTHSLLHDPTAIIGVRPYQPGDPLRSIHWPATAAVGTLVRRETERAWARDLVVVLDLSEEGWGRGERKAAEAAITVAASLLVDAILGHRQPAGMVVTLPGFALPRPPSARGDARAARDDTRHEGLRARHARRPAAARPTAASFRIGNSRTHLDAMLVHLATARVAPGAPLADLIRRHGRLQQPGTTVAVVANHLDDDLARALRSLRATGASPVLVHVAHSYVFARMRGVPPTGGVPRVEVVADHSLARLRL